MKKQLFIMTAAGIIAFLTILTAPGVTAQSGKTGKLNLEFDFYVGKTAFPAGEYIIESVSRTNDNILRIRGINNDGKNHMIIGNVLNAGKIQQPKLVFRRSGESYFLSQIFLESGQWGFSLNLPRKQKEHLSGSEKIEVRFPSAAAKFRQPGATKIED